ncbi:MAG: DUF1295 domain-containing protein [Spirochaetia bacterium]|nr:DUF1295 domain-containing protein [Spirochaetia bacterium]
MKATKSTIIVFFLAIVLILVGVVAYSPATFSALQMVSLSTVLTALLSFALSLLTNDYSWTDRLWSTLPVAYAWMYAYASSFTAAALVAALLITVWGARLTFNFARRGGYTGEEDYRWSILRQRIGNPLAWIVFNLLFIASYQQFLFIAFTSPLSLLTHPASSVFTPISFVAIVLFFLCLGIETLADQQQYTFQQAKHHLLERDNRYSEDYERGFRTSGLFRRSRHPNYFGELGVWWSMYLFCASFHTSLLHFTLAGPLLLTLLFIGSTVFTESITASKYPEYAKYQKRVPAILFRFW